MFQSKYVQKTELQVDLKALRKEFETLVAKYPTSKKHWQLALNSPISSSASPYDEIEYFAANHVKDWHMLDIYKGTEFEKLYLQMQEAFKGEFCRARINILYPQTCLAYHVDKCGRYLMALYTNDESFVVFEGEPLHHIPSDGYMYHLDAWVRHTVLNCGDAPRIHIVFDEKNPNVKSQD